MEVEEVTNATDLSMLERLQKGLPNVDAVEPDEEVIYDDTRDTDEDASMKRRMILTMSSCMNPNLSLHIYLILHCNTIYSSCI